MTSFIPPNISLPLTSSWAEKVAFPASFLAEQTYWPLWPWPTESMLKKDALGPMAAVRIPTSENDPETPAKLQVIANGRSPDLTMHEI